MIDHEPLWLPEQAANYLGMSPSWLSKSRLLGNGPVHIKIGRNVRYQRSALDAFLASNKRRSTSEVEAA